MPFPLIPVIAAGASLASAGTNAYSQGKMNKATREWNEKMYKTQRADSLQDWHMQNSYNSPQAAMARLQEAGLNPASAVEGGVGAFNAGSVNTPNAMPYKPSAPVIDLPQIVDGYFDVKMKQAQLNNLNTQNDLQKLDAVRKASENSFFRDTFNYRKEGEKHKNQLLYESVQQKAMANIFNSGFVSPHLNATSSDFSDDSAYGLQLRGMELANSLRKKEGDAKDVNLDINKMRRDYDRRIQHGDIGSFTFQDWLRMALQQIKPR